MFKKRDKNVSQDTLRYEYIAIISFFVLCKWKQYSSITFHCTRPLKYLTSSPTHFSSSPFLYNPALSLEAFLFFVPSLQWCPHNFKTSFKISCLYFQNKLMEF